MSEPVPLWLTNAENIGRDIGALIVFALMAAGAIALFYAGFRVRPETLSRIAKLS
jgi:hypothetical protein